MITCPTPILVWKGPLPTEESNLNGIVSWVQVAGIWEYILRALVVRLGGILEKAGVLDGDGLQVGLSAVCL